MSQALHTSTTGINAGQSQINVIANNVANINTTAYKSANMVFETLYSNNLSYGSAATKNGGGTNPKQIGLGVKIGGITRNFTPGNFVSTGRDMDCMISGTGFFVVQDASGKQFFTRDGVFNVDSEGNLVTQAGLKVVGAKSAYSNAGSSQTVKIPKNLYRVVQGDPDINAKTLAELNNASITSGVVKARVTDNNGNIHEVNLQVPGKDATVADLIGSFNAALKDTDASFSADNGSITYSGNIEFVSEGTTSNFLGETGLSANNKTSEQISQIVKLQDVINYNDQNAISCSTTSIDENGIIVATYNDGSILTQYIDEAETVQWKYVTPEGVMITGDDVIRESTSLREDANFVIELATMVNQEGLVSLNNNLWEWGPDVGDIFYGVAGEMAFGAIEPGGYEGSNVDIATELSNMIMAQRMIQMNSRVFGTASSVMETLSYLGQ
ncbi:MAG: flagellar hook-basal body complex protein [Candidatus Gastranaerophilales bacterium]|nr:flagellar hook-basal body complex protein [Candidatus Gastranaerophilales bacterium]MCM1072996.1 flagellar hook-basal body complex protein [Bacteroides sp.]